jgi:ribosomal protein L44E
MNDKDIEKKKEELSEEQIMKAELEKREANASLSNSEEVEEVAKDPSERVLPKNPKLKESETSPLGKVEMKPMTNRSSKQIGEEELSEKVSSKTKGIEIKLERLPTKGMFYPANTKIFIKSATVAEIKDFSLMDETNPLDVNDKLNNVLGFCTTVEYGVKKGNYKDLVEEDKMFVILSIKELTFPQGENKLNLKALCENCEYENTFELRTENLHYFEEDEKIAAYYDPMNRCYVVKTKDFGNIILSSPKIGVMQEITNYARSKQEKKQKWDRAAIQILPYLNLDWRGLDEKYIFNRLVEMESWSEKQFSLILRLTDKLKSGIKQTLKYSCKRCHENIDVEANIEGGMKSLFIRPLDDLLEEELI